MSNRWLPEAPGSLYDDARKISQIGYCAARTTTASERGAGAVAEAPSSFASVRRRRTSDLYRSDDRLLDPGLAGKPVVIGLTGRTKRIAEKHDASQESLTIGFEAGRNRATGLRTLDHNHTHANLPGCVVE